MLKARRDLWLENSALALYVLSVAAVMLYHEPWFDEAQAWLIARDANLFTILGEVLRYEGHPPLWHLVLYIPAHLGVPFELGIKLINLTFASWAAGVVIKKSPFPLAVRLSLPFTYFLFYQYGVISRSYSLLALTLFLTAAAFPERNRKPWKYITLLALLAGVTAHGMLIAFGTAVAWFLEIVADNRRSTAWWQNVKATFADVRTRLLIVLGTINLLYVAILWPMPDKVTPLQDRGFSFISFLYTFFIIPFNGVMTDIWPDSTGFIGVQIALIFLLWILLPPLIYVVAKNRGVWAYVLLSYLIPALFMSSVYFARHHTGIYTFMIIYCLWLLMLGRESTATGKVAATYNKLRERLQSSPVAKGALVVSVVGILAVQIMWTVAASIRDISDSYAPAKEIAQFIKTNDLEQYRIFNGYSIFEDTVFYSQQHIGPLAYFDHNIFYNLNVGEGDISYTTHKRVVQSVDELLLPSGLPDVVIVESSNPISAYWGRLKESDYTLVASFTGHYIWKNTTLESTQQLYFSNTVYKEREEAGLAEY